MTFAFTLPSGQPYSTLHDGQLKNTTSNAASTRGDIDNGNTSPSVDSNSTGRPSTNSAKSKFRRSLASLRSMLNMDQKKIRMSSNIIAGPVVQLDKSHLGPRVLFLHENNSSATTVINPGSNPAENYRSTHELGMLPQSAPMSPATVGEDDEPLFKVLASDADSNLRKAHSTPKLHRRISQKFFQTFGNPTIVKRPELQSRPSVQQLYDLSERSWWQTPSPLPSGFTSGSSVSPVKCYDSTPATSDGLPTSPSSVLRKEYLPSGLHARYHGGCTHSTRMSTIPEVNPQNQLSIVTVETAATAKMFLESHFNLLLTGCSPREVRLSELKLKLRHLKVDPDLQRKAIEAWTDDESSRLRYERQLNSQGIGLTNEYEVVQVLGKGSFGVVRLVKAKNLCPNVEAVDRTTDAMEVRRTSRADLAALRTAAKEALAPISNRRRQLDPDKKEVYAMKVIRKSAMLKNGQEGHLKAERDFLVGAEGSRWVISLLSAFQDDRHLYLVMDFGIGGDFLGLLIRKNTLSEECTQFYIAEMILCVEEAHRMRWIHRDVKPDNFLIGADGHLKISDFGLAFDGEWEHDQKYYLRHRYALVEKLAIDVKGDEQDQQEEEQTGASYKLGNVIGSRRKKSAYKKSTSLEEPLPGEPVLDFRNRAQRRRMAKSVVGTSQYMAPEVIRGDHYDGRCDWWSIGIIMYECMYGFTPFACEDRHNTKMKILKHENTLIFPEVPPILQPSWNAMDLICQLLTEPAKRLCSRRYALNDFTRDIVNGRPITCVANRSNRNYAGYFVYLDDAEDIKRHPFFEGIE